MAAALALAGVAVVVEHPSADAASPTTQAVAGTTTLFGAGCATASTCYAVGIGSGGAQLVPVVDGKAGTAVPIAGMQYALGVACWNADTCVVVGRALTNPQTAFLSIVHDGVPAAAQLVPGLFQLDAVGCEPGTTTCLAVGENDAGGVLLPIVAGVPGTGTPLGYEVALDSVSCPNATTCVAVGSNDAYPRVGQFTTITNGVPSPVSSIAGTQYLRQGACPSLSTCYAVGDEGFPNDATHPTSYSEGLLVPITAGSAGAVQYLTDTYDLEGIACSSGSTCTADGSVSTENGGSFSGGVTVPIVSGSPGASVPVTTASGLLGATCASALSCVTVGTSNASPSTGLVLATGTPGQLTASQIALSPAHPTADDASVTATVKIRNDYATTVTAVVPTLTSGDPAALAVTQGPTPASDASLGAGDTATFTYTLTPKQQSTVTLSATATAKDSSGATVTTPKADTLVVDLSTGDLSIAVAHTPSTGVVDKPETITATLTNKTASTLTALTPTLATTPSTGVTVSAADPAGIASLAPHASTTVSWTVTATKPATYALMVSVALTDPTTGSETDTGAGTVAVEVPALVVTTVGDGPEPAPAMSDDVCDVDPATDGDQCTLRAALQLAAHRGGAQQIGFDIPGDGVPLIAPATALPALPAQLTVDGSTQGGGWVQLSGAAAPDKAAGLTVPAGSDTIRGFVIDGWRGEGIDVTGGDGTLIVGDRIGTDPTGTTASPNGTGIVVSSAAVTIGGAGDTDGCTGECDLVSGNTNYGIDIQGTGSAVGVRGDLIGTDVTGGRAVPNRNGINSVAGGEGGNGAKVVVGGPTATPGTYPGNVISGNRQVSVRLWGIASGSVAGNLLGLDRTGRSSLQGPFPVLTVSTEEAVYAGVSALFDPDLVVGGPATSDRNVIGGFVAGIYDLTRVERQDGGPTTAVEGNRIGTDITGLRPVPNETGVYGAGTVSGNQISGNDIGVDSGAVVTDNLIGTTPNGLAALGNQYGVEGGGQIGAVRPAGDTRCDDGCNVISGNTKHAVVAGNQVEGNFIGTDRTGTAAIPNGTAPGSDSLGPAAVFGPLALGGPSDAVRTGQCDQACNLISGNAVDAVSGTSVSNVVAGNVIGLSASGGPLPNAGAGVRASGRYGATVGGDDGRGNRISDNRGPGVESLSGAQVVVEQNAMSGNTAGIVRDDSAGDRPLVPTLHAATRSGPEVSLTGSVTDLVSSADLSTSRVDVYASATCSGPPQGEVPLGHVEIGLVTDGSFVFSAAAVPASLHYLTATSTEGTSTSVLASCIQLAAAAAGVVSSPAVSAGSSDTVTGIGFMPGEQVQATLHSQPIDLGIFTADATGTVRVTFTVPRDLTPGLHHVVLTGLTSGRTVSSPLTVTAPLGSALPFTGTPVVGLLWAAAVALLVGGVLLLLSQRRRRT